jgi:hypothetical protein
VGRRAGPDSLARTISPFLPCWELNSGLSGQIDLNLIIFIKFDEGLAYKFSKLLSEILFLIQHK